MQFKKILAYALTVCLLLSLTIPAYAVEEVYDIADDVVPASVIYYSEGYYPGLIAEMRSSMTFANNRIAYGSYASGNYTPTYFYRNGSSLLVGDLPLYYPDVIADQSDVSAVSIVPVTSLVSGSFLSVKLPASNDAYFDFQSSNFLFDQQSPDANTFYVNGDLTFNLRNLWSFSGSPSNDSFYLASDPLAVQLLIDGKPYGDIIDVTGYTSPFTSLYGGAVPANATVHFDNMKVYYQGDTPDMIGFRVLTGSAFTDGRYNYNDGGEFTAVSITNTITFRCSELPDITFVQEGGDGYAGDLSGVLQKLQSGLFNGNNIPFLDTISAVLADGFDNLVAQLSTSVNWFALDRWGNEVVKSPSSIMDFMNSGFLGVGSLLRSINSQISTNVHWVSLDRWGNESSKAPTSIVDFVNTGFLGIGFLIRNLSSSLSSSGYLFLEGSGSLSSASASVNVTYILREGFNGLRSLIAGSESDNIYSGTLTDNTNTETTVSATGLGPMLQIYLDSMQDGLGKLSYVFASPEDLELKAEADPGTDAFRENFGGGASLSDIKDASELTTTIPQIMDSGFDFGDALEEIGSNDDFLKWFTSETWAALDSTGAAVAADPDYLSDYYDNLRKVEEKRHWGD